MIFRSLIFPEPRTFFFPSFRAFFFAFSSLLRCFLLSARKRSLRDLCQAAASATACEQALDLLVSVSFIHCCMSTSDLSPRSLQGVLLLSNGISLLEGGFTLRCLQRLSLPDLATQRCHWLTAGTPVVRPTRSSRTRVSSPQISCAHDG